MSTAKLESGVRVPPVLLTCPRDQLPLEGLTCPAGHSYPIYDGIPILLRDDVPETLWTISNSIRQARGEAEFFKGDYLSNQLSGATGFLYASLNDRVKDYPIPKLLLKGTGTFLDVGCNWGRWTIAAAMAGYEPIGIDPTLDALLAAKQACRKLGLKATFICADARYLPFPDNSFDQCYSFSVLQHFTKPDALMTISEMRRVGKKSTIQLAGKYGLRSFYHQAKRGFRRPERFEVRYWTPEEMKRVGTVKPHAFLGTGVLRSDVRYLPWYYKPIPIISEALRRLRFLNGVADSYWISF
jgi:SAM-dependent methyltransferase